MKTNIPFLTIIISILAASGVNAQNFRQSEPAFNFVRKGSLLSVKSASGEAVTTIDLDKPAFKGKVIAFTYSANKKKALQLPERAVNTVNIFPNPANRQVNLQFKGSWKYPVDVLVSDKNGNVLQTSRLESAEHPLDIGSFAPGVYILKAESGDTHAVEKLIVQ
nr:T9SS type A sorting domain-containing protein [uncultured Dyadobacter sp.]